MSTWVIISWVLVLALTAINVFLFLKLKSASEQMLKMAFPNAANMNDAMAQMQKMMGKMGAGAPGGRKGGSPFGGAMPRGNAQSDAQLKAAMDMLKNMQGGKKR